MTFHEPLRQFRWTLENVGLESFRVKSIKQRIDVNHGLAMIVEFHAFKDTDLSVCPMSGSTATLKFLDEADRTIEEYTITWQSMVLIPFLDLDYTSSENVVQAVELRRTSMKKN